MLRQVECCPSPPPVPVTDRVKGPWKQLKLLHLTDITVHNNLCPTRFCPCPLEPLLPAAADWDGAHGSHRGETNSQLLQSAESSTESQGKGVCTRDLGLPGFWGLAWLGGCRCHGRIGWRGRSTKWGGSHSSSAITPFFVLLLER